MYVVPYCTFVRYPTVLLYILFWDKKEAVGIHFILGQIEYEIGMLVSAVYDTIVSENLLLLLDRVLSTSVHPPNHERLIQVCLYGQYYNPIDMSIQ